MEAKADRARGCKHCNDGSRSLIMIYGMQLLNWFKCQLIIVLCCLHNIYNNIAT